MKRSNYYKNHSVLTTGLSLWVLLMACALSSCDALAPVKAEHGWFEFSIKDLDTIETDVDMSFLNSEEAGSSGRISVQDGHFADGNGNPVRFLGTNLTFSSAFPEKETSSRIAASLSRLGYNVVRFHHLDMRQSPDGIWDETMEKFDPEQLEKLDWLIYQLKKRGIYTNLNLHVSRWYPGLEEMNYEGRKFHFGKSIDQFFGPYIDLQKDYARNLLTHRNPYTGTAYTEEPAVAFVEINNENSLLSNWNYLPMLKGEHRAELDRQWNGWLATNNHTSVEDVFWISEHYDSLARPENKEMFWAFLRDTEMSYARTMTDFLRNELQVNALISETQASYSGIAGVLREAEFADFIDLHAYWEHPRFPGTAWSRTDWFIQNSSMVSNKNSGTLSRFGMHRVQGMPLTISEYDHPAPSSFSAEMYPMITSMGAFQNWDAIYHFTFNGPWDQGYFQGFFSSAGHPLKQLFVPVAAAIFRMGAVQPGTHSVQLQVPRSSVLGELVQSGDKLRLHGSNMDRIWTKMGAPAALLTLRPMEVIFGGDQLQISEIIKEPEGPWVSETGQLTWDSRDSLHAIYKINAGSAKAVVGYVGGKDLVLDNVAISMDQTESNWASIALVALDGKDISVSSKMLLVAAGRVENTDMGWNADHNSVADQWGKPSTLAEAIPATLFFRDMDRFQAFALDAAGNRTTELDTDGSEEEQLLRIGAQHQTLWYLLER